MFPRKWKLYVLKARMLLLPQTRKTRTKLKRWIRKMTKRMVNT